MVVDKQICAVNHKYIFSRLTYIKKRYLCTKFKNMLKEIVLIFGCLILGNIVRYFTGLSVPGSVFGMIILLIFLKTGVLNESQIKKFSNFLLDNMGFFFVPIGVGIALYLDLIKTEIFPILGASLISTLIILFVVGLVSGGRK